MAENFLKPEELKLKPLYYLKTYGHDRDVDIAQKIAGIMNAILNKLSSLTVAMKDKEDELKKSNVSQDDRLKNFLLNILEISDSFESVFASLRVKGQDDPVEQEAKYLKDRFKGIYENLLKEKLSSVGVTPIVVIKGNLPTPGRHKVIGSREIEEMEEGVICEETRKGYLWQGEILRQSWVKIAVKRKIN